MRAIRQIAGLLSPIDVVVVIPLVFLFVFLNGANTLLADADTGWHIRTGDWILRQAQVPRRDLFSFSQPAADWIAWEWLWDAAIAWLHQKTGMAAVVMISVVAIAASSALLYLLALRVSGNSAIAAVVTLVAVIAASIHWLARPHLVTLLFTVITLDRLERAESRPRQLLWLPPLVVLWTQIHGGFLIAMGFAASYATGAMLRGAWLRAGQYGVAAAGCLMASMVNPYGWRLHAHIRNYLSDDYQFRYIAEFQPLKLDHPVVPLFGLLLVSGIAAAAWDVSCKRVPMAALTVIWAYLAVQSARHLAIFAMIAAPVVARATAEWLAGMQGGVARAFAGIDKKGSEHQSFRRIPVFGCLGLLIVCALLCAPEPSAKFRADFDERRYPVRAVGTLAPQLLASRVFTTDEWGDYLIYRFYPEIRVFIDGRSDFYGSKFGEQYHHVLGAKPGWEEQLREFAVDTILMPVNSALAGALRNSPRWRLVLNDGVAVVHRLVVSADQVSPLLGEEMSAATSALSLRDRKPETQVIYFRTGERT